MDRVLFYSVCRTRFVMDDTQEVVGAMFILRFNKSGLMVNAKNVSTSVARMHLASILLRSISKIPKGQNMELELCNYHSTQN